MITKKILLYSPSLVGHPQVYCRVIGDILLGHGAQLVIASGASLQSLYIDWHNLRPFISDSRVMFVDTREYSLLKKSELSAEELRRLQKNNKIEITFFIEGDYFANQFWRIAYGEALPLFGRNIAIFSQTSRWVPGEDPYSGQKILFWQKNLRSTLGNIKKAILKRKESEKYFFEKILRKNNVVDAILVKDERITKKYGPPYYLMPEIYRVFKTNSDETRKKDWDMFAVPIVEYIKKAGSKNILLYFGTGAWYKGYDYFLKLAELDQSTFALHAGAAERYEPSKKMAFDTELLRKKLRSQGRLLETKSYIESSDLISLLFNSIERFVSTHRFTGSSGTILHALEYGKPVLTADTGLIGHQTVKYGLGMTYSYLDEQKLFEKWLSFRQVEPEHFLPGIKTFIKKYSKEEITRFFCAQIHR